MCIRDSFNIASGKQGCQICTQQESIGACYIDVVNSLRVQAVSYTHLDVYKRQQLEESMVEYERVSRQVLEDGTYRDPYHVEPVSYTHL